MWCYCIHIYLSTIYLALLTLSLGSTQRGPPPPQTTTAATSSSSAPTQTQVKETPPPSQTITHQPPHDVDEDFESKYFEALPDKPVQLVRPDPLHHLRLEIVDENVRHLHHIKTAVAVVAVVGKFHSGKSFLLNQLMQKQEGFGVGPYVRPQTMGIWMWGKVLSYYCTMQLLYSSLGVRFLMYLHAVYIHAKLNRVLLVCLLSLTVFCGVVSYLNMWHKMYCT